MKNICAVLAAVLLLVVSLNLTAANAEEKGAGLSGQKFGYVDLNLALNTVEEGKRAKTQLENDGKAKKQKLEIMQNELKKMKEDLDKQRLILSVDAMREKETTFQQKFMELQKLSMEYEKDFADKEANFIKPISEKMKRVIEQIGQKEGYTMIVPREMALYSPSGTDITDKVIAAYNNTK